MIGSDVFPGKGQHIYRHLHIKIANTGTGILRELQGWVFTKFFGADNIREGDPLGTSLGLCLVRSIADLLRGRIWFVSEYGQGTAFYVQLPYEVVPENL